MTRDELQKDREKFALLYDRCLADANSLKGVLQYLDGKIAELPPDAPEVPAVDDKKPE